MIILQANNPRPLLVCIGGTSFFFEIKNTFVKFTIFKRETIYEFEMGRENEKEILDIFKCGIACKPFFN